MDMASLLTAILLLPLLAAAGIACLLRRAGGLAAMVSVFAAAGILVLSMLAIFNWDGSAFSASMTWLQLGDLTVRMGFFFDYQAATMLAVVAFVGFFIHLFSVGYMDDDPAKGRFFGGLSIFMFSMLGIVLADNLFMIFVFWELVGFSSYMLIAHYWDKGFAAEASKKAFIVNRVGDFGFLIGIVWAWHYFGTADLEGIRQAMLPVAEGGDGKSAVTGIGLLLMCGFIGKSAQFPLQVWLTDAMAGPTPVSALIHAATMVAAGIYFMARVFFLLTPAVLDWVLWSAAILTVAAGFWALGQRDIKKSLAYSTLSHLGYMAVALGLGFPGLAMMHMAMHACFKATLFLCSGSVIHACHHEQDMFRMGGLLKKMPITALAFIAAGLSIAAFPYTAGFFSKDTIISVAYTLGHNSGEPKYYWVFGLTLLAALTTSLYMGRIFWVVFCGKPNSEAAASAHESSWWMTLPLVVLGCVLSIGAGWFVFGWSWLGGAMNALIPANAAQFMLVGFGADGYVAAHHLVEASGLALPLMLAGLAAMVLGFVVTFFYYGCGPSTDRLERCHPLAFKVLERHGWFDDFYDAYVRRVQQRFAHMLGFLDLLLINGMIVRGAAGIAGLCGIVLRSLHVGNPQAYIYWFLIGVLLFGAYAFGILG